MAKMFYISGRRGMTAAQYAPFLDDIIAGRLSVEQLALKLNVTEKTVKNQLRDRKNHLAAEAKRPTCPSVAIIGTVFWVSLDRKTWRIAEADGEGGFIGIGWSIKNGALYQSKIASVPGDPDKKWRAK